VGLPSVGGCVENNLQATKHLTPKSQSEQSGIRGKARLRGVDGALV